MTRNKKKVMGPGEVPKGQRRGVCGHFMQLWDTHSRCPGCRKKGKGQDPCVEDRDCDACLTLTVGQRHLLRTSRTHDSRSPRRRPSTEPVPTRFNSPPRSRGRDPERRPQTTTLRPGRSPVHRLPVHRSPVSRSTGHRSGQDMTGQPTATGPVTGHHRSTGQTTGPPVRPPVTKLLYTGIFIRTICGVSKPSF